MASAHVGWTADPEVPTFQRGELVGAGRFASEPVPSHSLRLTTGCVAGLQPQDRPGLPGLTLPGTDFEQVDVVPTSRRPKARHHALSAWRVKDQTMSVPSHFGHVVLAAEIKAPRLLRFAPCETQVARRWESSCSKRSAARNLHAGAAELTVTSQGRGTFQRSVHRDRQGAFLGYSSRQVSLPETAIAG